MAVVHRSTHVAVGAGLAGAKAVETLRQQGFDGHLVLIGAETDRPYDRPPLSKDYLAGVTGREELYLHNGDWYDKHDVQLRLGTRAIGLERTSHELLLDTGERLRFDKLLIATGSSARQLDVPGSGLAGVHYLRSVADADSLRAALSGGGRRVVIVGAGWIGLETAAAARGHGNHVTIVEPHPTPLHAVLGPELGAVFARLHRAHGVDLRLSTGVREVRGSGAVSAVVTDAGEDLAADLVIVGVGVRPNVGLAESGGLRVDNGIVTDSSLRSSDPDVYAGGDVTSWFNPLLNRRLRVEHWDNARKSGAAAARSMLGQTVSYDPVPYFFSDQYDLGMEYAGYAGPGDYDQIVYRGDLEGRAFVAFWLAGDRVVAGMNVNVWDVSKAIQCLIRDHVPVDARELADPDIPLDELATVRVGAG